MLDQSQGKIFLAAERGRTETDLFRSYNTFNYGNYQSEHKTPFGPLYVFNDDTLAGGHKISLLVEEDTTIILLPTVGAVIFADSLGNENIVEAGQSLVYAARKNTTILLGNPYDDELINFLQIWIRHAANTSYNPNLTSFDLVHNQNELVEAGTPGPNHKVFIGKFTGREETVYKLNNRTGGLFVFILEGAFEVQYRLLETRDGLALWDVDEVEIEALSNEAIVLMVEIPSLVLNLD